MSNPSFSESAFLNHRLANLEQEALRKPIGPRRKKKDWKRAEKEDEVSRYFAGRKQQDEEYKACGSGPSYDKTHFELSERPISSNEAVRSKEGAIVTALIAKPQYKESAELDDRRAAMTLSSFGVQSQLSDNASDQAMTWSQSIRVPAPASAMPVSIGPTGGRANSSKSCAYERPEAVAQRHPRPSNSGAHIMHRHCCGSKDAVSEAFGKGCLSEGDPGRTFIPQHQTLWEDLEAESKLIKAMRRGNKSGVGNDCAVMRGFGNHSEIRTNFLQSSNRSYSHIGLESKRSVQSHRIFRKSRDLGKNECFLDAPAQRDRGFNQTNRHCEGFKTRHDKQLGGIQRPWSHRFGIECSSSYHVAERPNFIGSRPSSEAFLGLEKASSCPKTVESHRILNLRPPLWQEKFFYGSANAYPNSYVGISRTRQSSTLFADHRIDPSGRDGAPSTCRLRENRVASQSESDIEQVDSARDRLNRLEESDRSSMFTHWTQSYTPGANRHRAMGPSHDLQSWHRQHELGDEGTQRVNRATDKRSRLESLTDDSTDITAVRWNGSGDPKHSLEKENVQPTSRPSFSPPSTSRSVIEQRSTHGNPAGNYQGPGLVGWGFQSDGAAVFPNFWMPNKLY